MGAHLGARGGRICRQCDPLSEGGTDRDVLEGRVLTVDLDTDEALDALDGFALRPTLTVASGGRTESGRPRLHAHFLLTEPIGPNELRDRQRALRDRLQGDPRFSASPSSVVRLPGTRSFKHAERCVELIADTGIEHNPAVLAEHLPESARRTITRPRPRTPNADLGLAIERASADAMSEIESGEGRNIAGFRLACEFRDLGLDEQDGTEIMEAFAGEVQERHPRDHPYEVTEARASLRSALKRPPRERPAALEGLCEWGRRALAAVREERPRSRTLEPLAIRLAQLAERHGTTKIPCSHRGLAADISRNEKRIGPALAELRRLGLIRTRLVGGATRCTLKISAGDRNGEREAAREEQADNPPTPPSTDRAFFHAGCTPFGTPLPLDHDAQAFAALGQAFPSLLALHRAPSPLCVSAIARLSRCHPRTVRRHLRRAASVGLAVKHEDGTWALDRDRLLAKLNAAGERFGTAGRGERMRARHERERAAFAEAQRLFAEQRAERLRALCRSPLRKRLPRRSVCHSSRSPISTSQLRRE